MRTDGQDHTERDDQEQQKLEQLRLLQQVIQGLAEIDMNEVRAVRDQLQDLDVPALQRVLADIAEARARLRTLDVQELRAFQRVMSALQSAHVKDFRDARQALRHLSLAELERFQEARRSLQDLDPQHYGEVMRNLRLMRNLHELRKLRDLDLTAIRALQDQMDVLEVLDLDAAGEILRQLGQIKNLDFQAIEDMQSEGGPVATSRAPRVSG